MRPNAPHAVDMGLCAPAPETWLEISETLDSQQLKIPSRRQLSYWSDALLLGKPQQAYVKGRPGSMSYYPAGTTDRLTAIMRVRAGRRRSIDALRFDLWWEGIDVDATAIRAQLRRDVRRSCRRPALLFEKYRGDPEGFADAIDKVVRKSWRTPRGAILRLLLRRLGDVEELFSFLWVVAFVVAGGQVVRGEEDHELGERSREQILDSAFGADKAMSDAWPDQEPALDAPLDVLSVYEQLTAAGVVDPTRLPTLVAAANAAAFDLARDRARVIIELLGGAADAAVRLRGRDAFGLGHFAIIFGLRLVSYVRGTAVVALLMLAQAAPAEQIDQLIALIEKEASGAIALGDFMRRFPSLHAEIKEMTHHGFDALDDQKQRRIREGLDEFLADQPELVTKLQLT